MLPERRVLFGKLCERVAQLVLSGLGLRLDRELDDRFRELHGLQDDRMLFVADRIARRRAFEADRGGDIARVDLLDLHPLIGMHLQDAADAFLFALGGVVNVRAGFDRSGIHAEIRELPDKRVRHDLEGERCERRVVRAFAGDRIAFFVRAFDRRNIRRRGHVLDDRVKEFLHALILVGGTAADRDRPAFAGRPPEDRLELFFRRLFPVEIHHHQIVVKIADLFNEFLTVFLGLVRHIRRDRHQGDIIALFIIIDVCLHLKEIDDPLEIVLAPDRKLKADRVFAEAGADLFYRTVEIRAHDIHLIDECHTRYVILIGLTPHILRLRLHTALRAEYADRTVQDTE